jgi:dipeptidase E
LNLVHNPKQVQINCCANSMKASWPLVNSRSVAVVRHIVALGGVGDNLEQNARMWDFVLGLTGSERPRVLFVPTASADDDAYIVWFYEQFSSRGTLAHLKTFPWPPENLRELVLAQDAICVGGGSTANMLAIWRLHGIDVLVRQAWEHGTVLFGTSAGMICWFQAGITDSFGPDLDGMDCLGFLPGSACPHYDGEERRRPRYHELVAAGFPAGIAADDGVGLHFVGTDLAEVVSCRPGAAAYSVTAAAEERLEARWLG